MMTPIEWLFHFVELGSAVLLLYTAFFGVRNFKLIVWKRASYLIGLGALFLILKNINEHLFIHTLGIEEISSYHVYSHGLIILAIICLAIGIFILSKSSARILGK